MAARMQAGNAGGLFQHAAALVGPRLDDLADAALVDQRGRARTGRGVGKQHGDVAGAHFAAVDAEGRALLAHDAARDFQRFGIVEGGRRLAVAVVDRHRHFGVIARRPLGVAGKDHVVHLGPAHGLVGGFPHDPAHGLDQIGFAAAVRTDDTGQPGFDHKVGRFDEGLEADQAQPRELHTGVISIPQAAAAKGIVNGSRPLWRVKSCRIGAENELSSFQAQQRGGVIQTFAPSGALPAVARRPAGESGQRQKTLILP